MTTRPTGSTLLPAVALAATLFLPSLVSAQATSADFPTSPLAKSGETLFRNSPHTAAKDAFVDNLDGLSWGSVSNAVLNMATNPTDADTLTIGADVYEFCLVATNDDLANATNIGVVIGVDVATTRLSLIAAINATDTDNAHSVLDKSTGGAAIANGTENVIARLTAANDIQIRSADAEGNNLISGLPSIVLAEGLTAAADIWQEGNVNVNTLGGRVPQPYGMAIQCKTLTAAMITNTVRFSFPFTVNAFVVQMRDSAGKVRQDGDLWSDTYVITNGDVLATYTGGVAPDAQATDVVCVIAAP